MSTHNTTRNHIRSCTATLIAELGYSGVKTRDIANKSGISEALVFKYFKTLDGLFEEVCRHCVSQFSNFSLHMPTPSNQKLLQAFIMAFFEHNRIHPESFLIYARTRYERRDLLEKIPVSPYHSDIMQEIESRFIRYYGESDGLLYFRAFRNTIFHELFTSLLEKTETPLNSEIAANRISLLFFPE